jgi:hypothetical protein
MASPATPPPRHTTSNSWVNFNLHDASFSSAPLPIMLAQGAVVHQTLVLISAHLPTRAVTSGRLPAAQLRRECRLYVGEFEDWFRSVHFSPCPNDRLCTDS